jgi:hypothetical protein
LKNRSTYSKERQSFIRKAQELFFRKIARAQNRLYSAFLDVLENLDTDNGRIRYTVRNLGKVQQVNEVTEAFHRSQGQNLGLWLGGKMVQLFGLNRLYMRAVKKYEFQNVDSRVLRKTMLKLGYDNRKSRLIRGGYLESLTTNTDIARMVGEEVNRAIAKKMPLPEFRKQFKQVFTDPNGLGMLERHFYTNSFDLFQQQDRAIALDYADELNLDYFVYSGTIKDNTRDFCKERAGEIFTREDIEKWAGMTWRGKQTQNYDPFRDLGGFNCRHSLDPIDEQTAQFILKRRK